MAASERTIARVRAVALVVVLAVLGLVSWQQGWADSLLAGEGFSRLSDLVERNLVAAVAAYVVAVVVGGVLLAVPGVVFAFAAGVLFGPWLGTACCVVASTLAAVVSFAAGRTFLQDAIRPLAMRNRLLRRWLFEGADRNAILTLLVTRMVPVVPFNLQNFAYGITDVKFSTYTWCTFLFIIPGTAFFTFAAASVIDETRRMLYLAIAAGLAVVVVLAGLVLHRRFVSAQDKRDEAGRAK